MARCAPVQPLASTGRSTPLASIFCVETTLPSATVVTSMASAPDDDGVMQTNMPFALGAEKTDSPATVGAQQPIHPCHLGPALIC